MRSSVGGAPTLSASSLNDKALIRLAANIVIAQNDEWLVGRRYLSQHPLESLLAGEQDDENEKRPKEEVVALTAA